MHLFVPGRVCLFGEHSDWAGGYRRVNADIEPGATIIAGTDQGIHADVKHHPTSLVLVATTPDGKRRGPYEISMRPQALLAEAEKGSFWSYIAGVAYQVLTHYHVRGLVLENLQTDLPLKKGLSSSAAICVLTARAFNRLYDLKLTARGEMELAYQGEITTPSRCGRMDQGCAFGNRAVRMSFDGDRVGTTEIHVPEAIHLVIVDLDAQKDTIAILNCLNHCFPFATSDVDRGVQDLLGPVNRRIVGDAVAALESGDGRRLGALMTEAQALFDRCAAPVCPEELTAPALHRVLAYPPLQQHIWGGKGIGSQGDGSAQLLARTGADQRAVIDILRRDLGLAALPLTLRPAPRVRTAVIPAAGFGTRLFPASKAAKKELFPIVDRDGIAKPAVLLIVEEALAAGIEQVVLVVQEDDLDDFRSFFTTQVSIELFNKLPPAFQEYAHRIVEMGRHVAFVVQPTQQGFGHAIACARDLVGAEPFLLMLGDHLYRSTGEVSCARQLLDAHQALGQSVVGLRATPEGLIGSFGAVAGVWEEGDRLLRVTEFAEKPTVDYARRHLVVPGLAQGEYLTVFGQYVLSPRIFDILDEHIAHNIRAQGEIQLTPALDRLRQEDGFFGLVLEGRRFDIGLPEHYLETLAAFGAP